MYHASNRQNTLTIDKIVIVKISNKVTSITHYKVGTMTS